MTVTKYQLMRKQRSEENLQRVGLEVNPAFPVLPGEADIQTRSAEEVAKRALALYNLLGVIFYESPEEVVQWTINEGLWDSLSPREKEIFSIPISDQDPAEKAWALRSLKSNILTWRIEALWVLLWCLGKVDRLELPQEKLDGSGIREVMPELGEPVQAFIEQARLRPLSEVLDQIDLHYRIYWTMSEAEEQEKELPVYFDSYILYERLHAFSWLAGFEEEWDD
ncbi:DUF4272 domain-containing protein [Thermoflavimicrobium dichotomicum]|uniref:DUF4272 domain-containing protein n=1 Tax=Thermoflavimicrobium dichotomicum TaxID=46223 RepID=A0A1I3RIY9_9BACL|nr:DUF4272 domain-containing protein [Thermoflavimicrobium dichotomicum]SFJ45257.1 protein of unknown function [Thermoflavimicrobium dichotomicum]